MFFVFIVCSLSDCRVGTFGVFAQDAEVACQRPRRFDGLPVTHRVVEGDIHVEAVFPLAADDRQRLYFREVDFVKREQGEHLGETSLGVGQREDQRCLVRARRVGEPCGAAAVGQQEETREVVFVSLDAPFQDFEPVELRRPGAADGGRGRGGCSLRSVSRGRP